jgi:hypothetical protein
MHESKPSDSNQVALEFLESALHLYFQSNAYSAALHLASAAEELLGKLLREQQRVPYLDFLQQIMMEAWNKLASEKCIETTDDERISPKSIATFFNNAKNHVKHSIVPATYDAQVAARDMLWRALWNYDGLQENQAQPPAASDLMERLYRECVQIVIEEPAERV